jgi:hypothetical protein
MYRKTTETNPCKKMIWSRLELQIGTYNQRENRGYKYDLLQIEFI